MLKRLLSWSRERGIDIAALSRSLKFLMVLRRDEKTNGNIFTPRIDQFPGIPAPLKCQAIFSQNVNIDFQQTNKTDKQPCDHHIRRPKDWGSR